MTPLFTLPPSSIVNKVVPKNSFDNYTTAKQRRLLSEVVDKIRWLNKLSPTTINLTGVEVVEIEVFEVSLKKKVDISDIIMVIDRAISYPIIFVARHHDECALFASQKHPHPTDENKAVVDWIFMTEWLTPDKAKKYDIELKKDLDTVFQDFCRKLSGKNSDELDFQSFLAREREIKTLTNQISDLQTQIKSCRQFKSKVELNLELQRKIKELNKI